MSRSIVLTGATGFIGRHVAARFVAAGDRVRAIVRPGSPRRAPDGVEVVHAPLTRDAIGPAIEDAEVVVHLAGVISARNWQTYTDVNVAGTREVAQATSRAGARLVHISSLAAAGPAPSDRPRTERDFCEPINEYGRSKLEGEEAVAAVEGLQWTILRPGIVYGPGDRALLPLFRLARLGVLPDLGHRDAGYTFVFIDDLVDAIGAAVRRAQGGALMFVGHPTPVTTHALATALSAALGRRVSAVRIAAPIGAAAAALGEIASRLTGWRAPLNRRRWAEMSASGFVCRVDELHRRLGFVAHVDLDAGFRRTLEWYRKAAWM